MTDRQTDRKPEGDVVISSRVRLARNLSDFPFPYKMDREQSMKVLTKVRDAFFCSNNPMATNFVFFYMQNLSPLDRQELVEKHLISRDLAESSRENGAIISSDGSISILINEEDHLRIQCLFPGMQLDRALELCSKIDELLEEKMDFAFSSSSGYLTCCPTNLGTGMRASAMLHLPALVMTGYIKGVLEACSKLGIAVRGMYGEHSEASGNMFQISNQVTLGQSENEIISNVSNVVNQIIEQERMLRSELYKQNPYRFEDKVYRSLGLFTNARIMSTEESLKLLSDVRLGVEMWIIKNIDIDALDEVMLITQPASLQKLEGRALSPDERDIKRAELIRNKLQK